MNKTDLAYAAGLIDGEGCVGVYRNSHNGNYQLRITVEMTVKRPLDKLYSMFGGRFYYKAKANMPNHKPAHTWMVFNGNAEKVLKLILPYLLVKDKQAKEAIRENWGASYNRFQGISKRKQGKRVTIAKRIKKLNARGKQSKTK